MMRRVFVSFSVTLCILIGLLLLTALIPQNAVRDNVLSSARKMQEDGDYYNLLEGKRYTRVHNYADAVTLNILINIGKTDKGVLGDIFLDPHYESMEELNGERSKELVIAVEQDLAPNFLYDRYWHGMMVYLKPLLVVTDITGIRIFSEILLFGMLGLLSVLLMRRKQKLLSLSFWIGAVMCALPVAAWTMEYLSNWLVMLGISIAVVFCHKDWKQLYGLITISGVCCAFFDFLTTETITFVVPIAIALLLRCEEGKTEAFRKELLHLGVSGVLWVVSYLLPYLIKWSISSLIMGANRFKPALEMFFYRQGGVLDAVDAAMFNQADLTWMQTHGIPMKLGAILLNVRNLVGMPKGMAFHSLGTVLLVLILLVAIMLFLYHGTKQRNLTGFCLILLAGVPILRYVVMYNHSFAHEFFTFRALFGSIVCLIVGLWNSVDIELLRKRFRRGGEGKKKWKK